VRIGEDDRHISHSHLADADIGHEARLTGNGFAGDADQLAHRSCGLRSYEHLAERGIADCVLGTGIDDRGNLDPVDRSVGHDQLAKAAARGDGDRLSVLEPLVGEPRQDDAVAPEIQDDVAALQHVGAEEPGGSKRGGGQDRSVDLALLSGTGLHMADPDRLYLVRADQALDHDRAVGREAQAFGETVGNDAAVGARIDRERKRALPVDHGHHRHAARRIGRGRQGFALKAAAGHAGNEREFGGGKVAADQG